MSNWQLHQGKYVKPHVQIELRQFKILERQARIGAQIDKLDPESKKAVLKILEAMMKGPGVTDEN